MNLFMMFLIGGLIYAGIEVSYDNTSHRAMILVGGLSFLLGGLTHQFLNTFGMPLIIQGFAIAIIVLILEYIGGRIFNSDYSIWDYRNSPLNLSGQICVWFGLIWWLVISPVIIWLWDILIAVESISIIEQFINFFKFV